MFSLLSAQAAEATAVAVEDGSVVLEDYFSPSLWQLFLEGGWPYMTVITLLLLAVLFCAWKKPELVKLAGVAALAFGTFSVVLGFYQAADAIVYAKGIESYIIWGGVKVALLPGLYGMIVYMVSLVARAFRKCCKCGK